MSEDNISVEFNKILEQTERDAREKLKKEIIEWANKYMKETTKIYGTDKHGISKEDLINFINK